MAAEPPSLPYARDEASTSQHPSAYPVYPGEPLEHSGVLDFDDEDLEEEEDEEIIDSSAALQYWTAPRHQSRKGKEKSQEEYCKCSMCLIPHNECQSPLKIPKLRHGG